MTASSASLPQRRRDALRQQLLDARSQGDQLAIKRIERQWVHRYGVETLLQLTADPLDLDSSLPAASADGQEEVVEDVYGVEPACSELAFTDSASDISGDGIVVEQPLSRIPLVALEQVPPPPVPRLHRLRRWIPTAANGLPKAS